MVRDMTVLGLDLGTSTGWAINRHGAWVSGTWDLAPSRGDSPGMRFIRLRRRLNELWGAYPTVRLVVYERPHHRGGHPTEVLLGLVAVVQEWCAERQIPHEAIHTGTLKKWATGSGRADKDAMMAACEEKTGVIPLTDDEADAVLLAARAVERGGENV